MSCLPKELIRVIAQTVGVDDLSEELALRLANDAEYRLREVVQEATKFMRHSKRTVMTTYDVSAGLKLRNIEVRRPCPCAL